MSNIQIIEFINVPVDDLVSGEITWKDYISSLSPEDLEKQRQYDRARVKKWYQANKERKQAYSQGILPEEEGSSSRSHQLNHPRRDTQAQTHKEQRRRGISKAIP
jgi:hypothetical protein